MVQIAQSGVLNKLRSGSKFRFHCLGLPHSKTHRDFSHCAYSQKVWKFCKMMHERGHYVIHYGAEGSNPPCDENVDVIPTELWNSVYGSVEKQTASFQMWGIYDDAYLHFTRHGSDEVNKRLRPGDFVLAFFGNGLEPLCKRLKGGIVVEPGIGYPDGVFAKYRIWESYALMHACWGAEHVRVAAPNWYDRVIPNYFDLDEFDYCEDKQDYFLYIGRVYDGKGVGVAIDACRHMNVKLKIAGHLDPKFKEQYEKDWGETVEYCGPVLPKERSRLMGHALGTFAPTWYVEPFGGVQVEAMLCGTPTITTDFGAFTENNIHGVTGYRCWTFRDFCTAIERLVDGQIDYRACRKQGEKFSLENVAPMYEKFFGEIHDKELGRGGWYSLD